MSFGNATERRCKPSAHCDRITYGLPGPGLPKCRETVHSLSTEAVQRDAPMNMRHTDIAVVEAD